MLIHWLLPFITASRSDLKGSHLASIRMRAVTAADAIQNSGGGAVQFGELVGAKANILVIGKIGADCGQGRDTQWLETIRRFKSGGGSVVLDYTDHHLGFRSPMTHFYQAALPLVDHTVVPSTHMRDLLLEHWGGNSTIIPDPIEIAPQALHVEPGPARRLLWFGHSTNVSYLIDFLAASNLDKGIELWALSNQAGLQAIHQFMAAQGMQGRLGLWTLDQMQAWAHECHACIIPSDPSDPRKAGASSNRLITALALGLPTAADLLASYLEFKPFFADIKSKELTELLARPSGYRGALERALNEVVPEFDRRRVGARWLNLFESLIELPQ